MCFWHYVLACTFGLAVHILEPTASLVLLFLVIANQISLFGIAALTHYAPPDSWLVPKETPSLRWRDVWVGAFLLPSLCSIWWLSTSSQRGLGFVNQISLVTALVWLVACYGIFESVFYLGHRLLHDNKRMYRIVHAQHHKRPPCYGYSAYDLSPIDWFLQVSIPAVTPLLLLNPPLQITATWLCAGMLQNYISHAGVEWGWVLDSRQHYLHHHAHQKNFATGAWDRLMGTYAF